MSIKDALYNKLRFRKTFADRIPYVGAYHTDGTYLMRSGALATTYRFQGPDAMGLTSAELEYLAAMHNSALGRLDEEWMVNIDIIRDHSTSYAHREFGNPTSALLDKRRRFAQEQEGAHFETHSFLTTSWLPPPRMLAKLGDALSGKPANAQGDEVGLLVNQLRMYQTVRDSFTDNMRASDAVRLKALHPDDTFRFLHACIQGGYSPHLRVAPEWLFWSDYLATDVVAGRKPVIGGKHLAVLSFDAYPHFSEPAMLNLLTQLPLAYRFSMRLAPVGQSDAQAMLERRTRNFFRRRSNGSGLANLSAMGKGEDAQLALKKLNDGTARAYMCSATLLLFSDSLTQLEDTVRAVSRAIEAKQGFRVRYENQMGVPMDVFEGTWPGVRAANLRRDLILSDNVADLLPMHGVWAGMEKHPNEKFYFKGASPLLYAKTSGYTPFRFFHHADDLGMFGVFGKSGGGKSVLLAAMADAHMGYHNQRAGVQPQVFAFDVGYSLYATAMANGGAHVDLAPSEQSAGSVGFCPFADLHIESERNWALTWVKQLCVVNNLTLNQIQERNVRQALDTMATGPGGRRIHDFVNLVQDDEVKEVMKKYTQRAGTAAGKLLDTAETTLSTNPFIVFEVGALLNMSDDEVLPVLWFIFHTLERRYGPGKPTLLLIDETPRVVGHPAFRTELEGWLTRLRKAGVSVGVAAQYIEQLDRTGLRAVFQQGIPTKILLQNSDTTNPEIARAYKEFAQLTDGQVSQVATMTRKRDYMVVHPSGVRVVDFAFSDLDIAIYGASGTDDLPVVRRMVAEHGQENWVPYWLEHKGLPVPAQLWRDMKTQGGPWDNDAQVLRDLVAKSR